MKRMIFLSALLFSMNGMAKDFQYAVGVSTTVSNYSYQDTDGDTESTSVTVPLSIFGEMKVNRVNKLFVGIRAIDFDVDASTSGDMGVDVEGMQIEAAWLHKVRIARHFKPWFGIGIRTSIIDAKKKHEIDSDGFLVKTFENSEETFLGVVLKANADWEIGDGWFIDAGAAYDQPIGDGVTGYNLSAGIKYEL